MIKKIISVTSHALDPLPPVTNCHTFSDPPIFIRPSTKKTRQKPPVQILSQLFTVAFVRGLCQGVFCLEGFVRGGFCPFPLLSEYICYNKKLNITLNFMFHMYDKKNYKRDVTCS